MNIHIHLKWFPLLTRATYTPAGPELARVHHVAQGHYHYTCLLKQAFDLRSTGCNTAVKLNHPAASVINTDIQGSMSGLLCVFMKTISSFCKQETQSSLLLTTILKWKYIFEVIFFFWWDWNLLGQVYSLIFGCFVFFCFLDNTYLTGHWKSDNFMWCDSCAGLIVLIYVAGEMKPCTNHTNNMKCCTVACAFYDGLCNRSCSS